MKKLIILFTAILFVLFIGCVLPEEDNKPKPTNPIEDPIVDPTPDPDPIVDPDPIPDPDPVYYTISVVTNSSQVIEDFEVLKGSKIDFIVLDEVIGLTFDNWYIDNTFNTVFNFNSTINSNITLYGKFVTKKITITFDTKNGTSIAPLVIDYGTIPVKPTNPQKLYDKDIATFRRWAKNNVFSDVYRFDVPLYEDTVLSADWTYISLSIGSRREVYADGYYYLEVVEINSNYVLDGWRYKEVVIKNDYSGNLTNWYFKPLDWENKDDLKVRISNMHVYNSFADYDYDRLNNFQRPDAKRTGFYLPSKTDSLLALNHLKPLVTYLYTTEVSLANKRATRYMFDSEYFYNNGYEEFEVNLVELVSGVINISTIRLDNTIDHLHLLSPVATNFKYRHMIMRKL